MCAIIYSQNIGSFLELMQANSFRGTTSIGLALQVKGKLQVMKYSKDDKERMKTCLDSYSFHCDADDKHLFAHCQAPTTGIREWNWETSHPFTSGSFTTFHNGVINNVQDLCEEFNIDSESILVDSDVFAKCLDSKWDCSINRLERILSKAEGTFALIIVDSIEKPTHIYVARQGSTLYKSEGSSNWKLSSVKTELTPEEVPEGMIFHYNLNTQKVQNVQKFKSTSPFLVI